MDRVDDVDDAVAGLDVLTLWLTKAGTADDGNATTATTCNVRMDVS